jgi:hypothetical protein
MKKEENKDVNMPKIKIKKSLEQYKGKVIFPNLVKKANETLKNIKLPDVLKNQSKSP